MNAQQDTLVNSVHLKKTQNVALIRSELTDSCDSALERIYNEPDDFNEEDIYASSCFTNSINLSNINNLSDEDANPSSDEDKKNNPLDFSTNDNNGNDGLTYAPERFFGKRRGHHCNTISSINCSPTINRTRKSAICPQYSVSGDSWMPHSLSSHNTFTNSPSTNNIIYENPFQMKNANMKTRRMHSQPISISTKADHEVLRRYTVAHDKEVNRVSTVIEENDDMPDVNEFMVMSQVEREYWFQRNSYKHNTNGILHSLYDNSEPLFLQRLRERAQEAKERRLRGMPPQLEENTVDVDLVEKANILCSSNPIPPGK